MRVLVITFLTVFLLFVTDSHGVHLISSHRPIPLKHRLCNHFLGIIKIPEVARRLSNRARYPDTAADVCPAAFQNSGCHNVSEALLALAKEQLCLETSRLYTQNISCTICENLFQVAIALPKNPETAFKARLRLYCGSLEFLDPPCNMIADEYDGQIYEMSSDTNHTNFEHCKTLTLCI